MFLSLHTLTSRLKLSCLSDAYTALNYMPFKKLSISHITKVHQKNLHLVTKLTRSLLGSII